MAKHSAWLLLLLLVSLPAPQHSLHAQSGRLDFEAHLAKAEKAYTAHNWGVAVQEYGVLAKLAPNNAQVLARLGAAYQKLGRLSRARDSLNAALKLDPRLPDVGVVLAFVEIGLGEYSKAVPLLEEALDNPRDDLPVRIAGGERLVDLDFVLRRQDRGLIALQKLRKLAPDDPDILYTASRVYSGMWKSVVERMYAKVPNSYRTHQVLAEAAEAKGNLPEAAKEYRLVLKIQPGLPGIHYQLGRIILQSSSSPDAAEQALAEFQEELKIDPRDVPANTEMGEIYLKTHRLDDATRCFSKAIQAQPSYAQARLGLGQVFLGQKKFRQAADQFEAAARLSPSNPTAYYELMVAYRALGQNEEAKAALTNFERLRTQAEKQQSQTLTGLQAPLLGGSH